MSGPPPPDRPRVPLDLLPFLVASMLVTVAPIADTALATRQGLVGGTRWPSGPSSAT